MNPEAALLVQSLSLAPPRLGDNTADADRLAAGLKKRLGAAVAIDLHLLRRLPALLREAGWKVDCLVFPERGRFRVLAVQPAGDPQRLATLAVDLGTTRIALRLIAASDGAILHEAVFDNPQAAVGPDILARIHHAERPGGLEELRGLVIEALNRQLEAACAAGGLAPGQVMAAAVAGNTAMTHLMLGLPPRWLIREPYIPAVNTPPVMTAAEVGLAMAPTARIFVFPNVGSYFGGDLVAGILATGMAQRPQTCMLVDVGTNAEVVVGNDQWLVACAGAAGPALEAGVTAIGMNAGTGVIDRVRIDPQSGEFHLHTIGGAPPRGICGSGVIDLAAELYRSGMIDFRGKFVPEACGGRLVERDGMTQLVLVPAAASATGRELTIAQADLDSLMRSKAAMYAILETITASVGIGFEDLEAVYVAGTFGAFIDPRSAIAIGMLPALPLSRYRAVGNSSLAGAARLAAGRALPEEIDRIRGQVTYLELNVNQEFMNRFSAAKFLPRPAPPAR